MDHSELFKLFTIIFVHVQFCIHYCKWFNFFSLSLVNLYELKTYHEVIDEIYYKVSHLEPWEKGSRKTAGQTGMCGGVSLFLFSYKINYIN